MQMLVRTVNTKDVEINVGITMTLSEWESLLEQLPGQPKWPLYQFVQKIEEGVRKVKHAIENVDMPDKL